MLKFAYCKSNNAKPCYMCKQLVPQPRGHIDNLVSQYSNQEGESASIIHVNFCLPRFQSSFTGGVFNTVRILSHSAASTKDGIALIAVRLSDKLVTSVSFSEANAGRGDDVIAIDVATKVETNDLLSDDTGVSYREVVVEVDVILVVDCCIVNASIIANNRRNIVMVIEIIVIIFVILSSFYSLIRAIDRRENNVGK